MIAVFLALVAGCRGSGPAVAPDPAGEGPLVVLAASSLTEVLEGAGAAWTASGHPRVRFAFDASSRLARQVEAGALADLYVAADLEWMDYLAERGLVDGSTRMNLAGNTLVAVLPATSTRVVEDAAALGQADLARIGLAGEGVPAGKYARRALAAAGVWERVEGRIVEGESVRTVLGWVATGEVDAGVVYATDLKVEPRVRLSFTFPATSHPPIVYPAAVVKHAAHAAEAALFLAWCRGPEGRARFAAAGFTEG